MPERCETAVPYEEVPKEVVGEDEKTGQGLDHLTVFHPCCYPK